jgi:hypothetical protein
MPNLRSSFASCGDTPKRPTRRWPPTVVAMLENALDEPALAAFALAGEEIGL